MKEIRWHGRGGNGAFTAARLLGLAASVYGGHYAQAFPSFGPERRGAPVLGFTRIDDVVITDHSQIVDCDCVIVLDETLIDVADVLKGLRPDGVMVSNSSRSEVEFRKTFDCAGVKNLVLLDGTSIALDVLQSPIVNTVMLGAAVAAADLVDIGDAERAIGDLMPKALAGKNKDALRTAYKKVKAMSKT
ncbi:MAG: 2-oxoacid:acceptor oxidoreductase family protein [Synergistaceae bacterium]|nr:2-oxoacid:acceptor oxidoreductase family protein [Synergistaceae bacterium]